MTVAARLLLALAGAMAPLAACAAQDAAAAPARPVAWTPDDAARVHASVAHDGPVLDALADALWRHPELGYQERESSGALQRALRDAGFEVRAGVAGMPTAFVARFRRGDGPVVALLAEMDALPGMSQAAVPQAQPVPGQDAGHACGHNLFGPAAVVAARTVRAWLEAGGAGEVRVYGTPAEEGGSGKVYMVKAGLFDDVDVVLHWHPSAANSARQDASLANISGKFRFEGVAAHAALAPERGRSALDGVEALDYMANLMREHVPDGTRIHYVVSDGGGAPNVVPARAEAYYYVRHRDPGVVRDVFGRLRRAAEGAAMGTGTEVAFEQTGGVYSLLPNDVLGRIVDAALREVGGVGYDDAETRFATRLQASLDRKAELAGAGAIEDYGVDGPGFASTDVGDVSWTVPTAGVSTATWVPGTAAHSWQAVAASGMSIGHKGARNAAEVLALAAVALLRAPDRIAAARAEFDARRGAGFAYRPLLERDDPPLDYRRVEAAKP